MVILHRLPLANSSSTDHAESAIGAERMPVASRDCSLFVTAVVPA
jgi:hypothetical protein